MKVGNLILILSLAALTACGKSDPSSGNVASNASQGVAGNATANYTCTFTEVDEFTISQDPTQDFNVSSGTATANIQNNTCNGVSNGLVNSNTLTSADRTGGIIVMTEPSNGSDTIQISNNQATIPQSDLAQCSSGVQGTGTLSEVELDPIHDKIRVYTNWNLVVNGCTQASPAAGQSAPAPVEIDTQ